MLISDNVLNVLAACEYRGIGKAWINKNLHGGETTEQVVRLVSEKDGTVDVCGFERRKASIKAEICILGDAIDGVTGIGDVEFPTMQSGVKEGDRPIALFYKGDISLIKTVRDNVAVIGLLTPSQQIEDDERKVVSKLVEQGRPDEIYDNPIHPYTKALLSAIPAPDPDFEKWRGYVTYDPKVHDYSVEKPSMHQITETHSVYLSDSEMSIYVK